MGVAETIWIGLGAEELPAFVDAGALVAGQDVLCGGCW